MKRIVVKHCLVKDFRTVEAIKTLRTNLMFSGERVRAVALTSFHECEGKSTIAFQLAASLAQAGKRVLLIDADMRKSVMASRMRVGGKVDGLSQYLSGMANIGKLLYRTDIPGLYMLFAGTKVVNAAELLGSERYQKLTSAAKEIFDYVIVDAPPLGQVVDCAVMAPLLDGVLLVVDTGTNSYKLLRRMKSQLERSGGRILGAVLNRVDFRDKDDYGKSYSYGGCGE